MFKFKRVFTSLFIIVALCASSFYTGFCAEDNSEQGEQTESVNVEEIIADSVIYYSDYSRLLNHGKVYDLEQTLNDYYEIDGVDYAEISWVCGLFDLTYAYDGKNSSIVFTQNKTKETFSVKSTTLEKNTANEKVGLFLNDHNYVPIEVLAEKMGFHYYKGDGFWAVSESYDLGSVVDTALKQKLEESGKTVVAFYDFEGEGPELELMYGNDSSEETFAQPCGKFTENGNTYVQIGATSVGSGGYHLPYVPYDKSKIYAVEFDMAKSADFSGSNPRLVVNAYKDGRYLNYITGLFTTPKTAGTWTHYTVSVNPSSVPEGTADLDLNIALIAKAGENASGKIMFDNIKVTSCPPAKSDNDVTPNITADKAECWYILGETITMTPQNKIDAEKYPKMVVDIYDSYDNLVHSETVKTVDFNNGYKWTPMEQGFYGYDFFTINTEGVKEELNEFILKKDTKLNKYVKIYTDRNTVVVAAHPTKPMEERSGRLAVSMDTTLILDNERKGGFQGNQMDIADLIGFKKMRLHFIRPDGRAYAQQSLANKGRGDFDFSEWDQSVINAKNRGYELVINILGIPRYSTPYRTGVNAPDGTIAQSYMPIDIDAWRSFVEYTVKRYKDDCRIWEIWNEPNIYGASTFCHMTTPDYAKIQKTAYDVIKKYQPGSKSDVLLGGVGTRWYVNFYEELVQTEGYDAFDLLPLHGYDVDYWTYQDAAKAYGKEPKRICSTEMHMMLRSRTSQFINNDEKDEALRLILEFLKDFKYGAEFTTFFQIYASCDIEWLNYVNEHGLTDGSLEGGLYNVGHKQPRFAAMALNTFFDTVGKQYDYVDEYLLVSNKQNVVRVNSNGKDQLIVWNVGGSKSSETKLSKQITDAAAEDFKIIDWEGHVIDTSDFENISIKPGTMYFISGLNSDKLDLIESAQGEKEYTGKVLYNRTEKQKIDLSALLNHPVANGSSEPLFDKTTFALKDNINYIDDDWYWVEGSEGAQQGDFDAKYAVSVAEDGMYLVVKVNDTTDNPDADSAEAINLKDSIEFAFDTANDRTPTRCMECYVGLVNGKPVIYKKTAPDIGGDIVPGFVDSGNIINDSLAERTVNGSEVTYKIFLPTNQIYPYVRDVYTPLHLTVLANQNDGSGNIGHLEWASGTGGEKDPSQYGDVWLDSKIAEENKVYYPPFAKGGNKPLFDLNTLECIGDINWINDDEFNWVKLTDDDPDYKARAAVSVTDDGLYFIGEVEDRDMSAGAKRSNMLWNEDSMQFAVDSDSRGFSTNRLEFQVGRMADGTAIVYKESAPYFPEASKPEGYTNYGNIVENCVIDVKAENGKHIYKMFIPMAEFYPFKPSENKCMKLSWMFNQNKEGKRIGYKEWSSGIGSSKDPKQYGIVRYR